MRSREHEHREQEHREQGVGAGRSAMRAHNRGLYYVSSCALSSRASSTPSTSSRLRQGPTHVTDTGRCPTPCPTPTEVARLGQLFFCCSRLGASPSSRLAQSCSLRFGFPAQRCAQPPNSRYAAVKISSTSEPPLFSVPTGKENQS